MTMARALTTMFLAAVTLWGCDGTGDKALPPAYLGIETRLLDDQMVNFRVAIRHAEALSTVEDYAACAAAQYALIRGHGFARHVRTNVNRKGAVTLADAVYLISSVLPKGVATIDAETTVRDCSARGIPTV